MPRELGTHIATVDPVALLQERMGLDEAQAADLALIGVECPVPGQAREATLGEFISSGHGIDKAEQILDLASQAKEKGATAEDALAQALGFAAIRDRETGGLVRLSPPESKKK